MNRKFNFLQIIGFLLVLLSFSVLIGSEWISNRNSQHLQELTLTIQSRLPERIQGDPESYSDAAMPVLEIDGMDFCGLLELPAFGLSLPIGSSWDVNSLSRYPCRFWGSTYDSSLIIGGANKQDHFGFITRLDIGDKISVTDMTGTEFSYEVTRIDRRSHADMDSFLESSSDLTLFVKDKLSQNYIIVRCSFGI